VKPDSEPDQIRAGKVLFDTEQIARLCGLPLAPGDSPAVEWNPKQKPRLELPLTGDWLEFDQLRIRLAVAEGAGGELAIAVTLKSRTPGLEQNDSFFTIFAIGNSRRQAWSGWRDIRVPFENFNVNGQPVGWRDLDRMTLTLHYTESPVLVSELRIEQRPPVRGPRLTDERLLAELDLARGDLRRHFQNRLKPLHSFHLPGNESPSLAEADAICRNVIEGCDLGATMNWRANPDGHQGWTNAVHRHYFIAHLLDAWHATHDPRYAAKMDELLASWIAEHPVPLDGYGGGPAWSTLSTGCRFKRTWLNVFFSLAGEPAFRDETFLAMLKSMFEHAEFLLAHSTLHATNWLVIESQALALIGMMLPEFRRASLWREAGWQRLTDEIQRQVYPDGAHRELSPGYHISSCTAFAQPFELARRNELPVPAAYEERLRRSFEFIARLRRPDGTLPSHNDSGSVGLKAEPFLRYGARLFGETPPAPHSQAFAHSGLFVMRAGSDADARWLFFDGGPFGAGHQHEDKLGIDVYAYGTHFLADPGITNYRPDAWFRHYRSTGAHNTVMVDGGAQQRGTVESREQKRRDVSGENFWASGRGVDVARSEYRCGYVGVAEQIVHRRTVVFVKPDYWLVLDEIEGRQPHRVETLWHFLPLRVERDGLRVHTARAGKANLEIIPLMPAALDLRIVCGQTAPPQGWVSINGDDVPAPCAIYRTDGPLPVRQVWALVPSPAGSGARLLAPSVTAAGDATRIELRFDDGRQDAVLIRWTAAAPRSIQDLDTDGFLAFHRRDAQRHLVYSCAVGSSAGNLVEDRPG
jgi:hypothetical protein